MPVMETSQNISVSNRMDEVIHSSLVLSFKTAHFVSACTQGEDKGCMVHKNSVSSSKFN